MPNPDPNFRPDPNRSIFISGLIDSAQIRTVAPQILKLRSSSSSPITVYINSNGGFTNAADTIYGLLTTRDLDKQKPRIITVATGNAKSAAADLLAFGDYAYAYPHSSILFHGARYGTQDDLTAEDSLLIASSLGVTNDRIALRLAEASVQRIVLQYWFLKKQFPAVRTSLSQPNYTDLECFVSLLQTEVESEWAKRAIIRAFKRCTVSTELSNTILPKTQAIHGESMAQYEAKILKEVINYELAQRKEAPWTLDADGVHSIVEDYLLLRDYWVGSHTEKWKSLLRRFGVSFLTPEEKTQYEQMQTKTKEEIRTWLTNTGYVRVRAFWYFVVSLWRQLQREENSIGPMDAYYLGVVDEVYGTGLASPRLASEQSAEPKQDASSSSGSAPPVAQSAPAA